MMMVPFQNFFMHYSFPPPLFSHPDHAWIYWDRNVQSIRNAPRSPGNKVAQSTTGKQSRRSHKSPAWLGIYAAAEAPSSTGTGVQKHRLPAGGREGSGHFLRPKATWRNSNRSTSGSKHVTFWMNLWMVEETRYCLVEGEISGKHENCLQYLKDHQVEKDEYLFGASPQRRTRMN